MDSSPSQLGCHKESFWYPHKIRGPFELNSELSLSGAVNLEIKMAINIVLI